VLELSRLTPIDINFLEKYREANDAPYVHELALLRFELMDEWFKDKARTKFAELREQRQKSAGGGDQKSDDTTETGDEETRIIKELTQTHRVNPDVSYRIPEYIPKEQVEKYRNDQEEVREVGKFLTETVLPKFVMDIAKNVHGVPINGSHLTSMMHKRGINMRYLGSLYNADCEEWRGNREAFKQLVLHEVVVRALKHIIREAIGSCPVQLAAHVIVHYINLLLSTEDSSLNIGESLREIYPKETAILLCASLYC
jgi:protein TIF31